MNSQSQKVHDFLHKQFDFVESLDSKIQDAIVNYTSEAYESLNRNLREGKKLSGKQQDMLDLIDIAFKNVPRLESPITVYRNVANIAPVDMKINEVSFNETPPDEKFELEKMKSIISASYDKNYVSKFERGIEGCCILVITLPVGSAVLPIENISSFKNEREVLLNRNGVYKLTYESIETYEGRKGPYQSYTYYITYIPEHSILIN
jgi:hypothetical protein